MTKAEAKRLESKERNMNEIKFTITIEVGVWHKDEDGIIIRNWLGGPMPDEENTAAQVTRKNTYAWWPFQKWEWNVWSPFQTPNKDGRYPTLDEGAAPTEQAAKNAADAALARFVASLATDRAGASVAVDEVLAKG